MEQTPPAAGTMEKGKLFVGGISSDTREEALAEHFGRYGEVKEAAVMRDRISGNGRGFGFVQFTDPVAAESALKEAKHVIRGRTVEVKRAIPRGEQHQNQQHLNSHRNGESSRFSRNSCYSDISNGSKTNSKKIFIGGLPDNVTQHELKSYFEKFGSVIDTVVMYDNTTQRPRGFGFITFSSEETVAVVLQNSHHELNGKLVEVKIAVPKDDSNYTNNRNNDNYHNAIAIGGRGPVYGPYQGNVYPSYGYYGCFNYVTPPFSPYFYGGLYGGGYNISGLHGVGYGGLFDHPRSPWNDSKRMLEVKGGFGMLVAAGGHAGGHAQCHESIDTNENQDGPDVQTTLGNMAESQVEVEDVKCDTQ